MLFADRVSGSSDAVNIGEPARLLHSEGFEIGQNRLFKLLRDKGILMKNNLPYQKYIDRKYFKVVESAFTTPYGTGTLQTVLVTGRGQVFLVETLRPELCGETA